jgi:predicted nucleic acid-binding protein
VATVYLETSFFSACVDTRDDGASKRRQSESQTWWTSQRKHHALVFSAEVLKELSNPAYPNRDLALKMTAGVSLLPLTDEVIDFAILLVSEKVMPGPESAGDAIHVAAATVHRVDCLLTWNQRHLANVNKVKHLQVICRLSARALATIHRRLRCPTSSGWMRTFYDERSLNRRVKSDTAPNRGGRRERRGHAFQSAPATRGGI